MSAEELEVNQLVRRLAEVIDEEQRARKERIELEQALVKKLNKGELNYERN